MGTGKKPSSASRRLPIVVDAGPLIAIANAADDAHETCLTWLDSVNDRRLIVPVPVLTEVCWLIGDRQGPSAEADFLQHFAASPQFRVFNLDQAALVRMALLVERYADFPLGMADASVIVAAEQHGVVEVATLDRRHFRAVRPSHVEAFTLLPDDYPG